MRILVLDDDHERLRKFRQRLISYDLHLVETSKEAINKLFSGEIFDYVFLDHDLGGQIMVASGENTGYEVARWIQDHEEKRPGQVIVHSFNPVGAKNMMSVLPHGTLYIPGVWLSKFPWEVDEEIICLE